ncbi:putative fimbrial usher, partial [Bordetella avium 197N]
VKPLRHLLRNGSAALVLALTPAAAALAQEEAVFDSRFLHRSPGQPPVDLSVFAKSNRVVAGPHDVMMRLNELPIGRREVDFERVEGKLDAQPCLPVPFLEEIGVNVQALPALLNPDLPACGALAALPGAIAQYNPDTNLLNLYIPQAMLKRRARGVVDRSLWDDGTTAFWTSYRLSYGQTRYSGDYGNDRNTTTFLSVRNGFNLGEWRFRANGSYYRNAGNTDWNWNDFYAQRGLPAWRGLMRLGDSSTSGRVFNAVRLRGVQLQSDDGMLPDSLRGYAPVVRGIAQGNSKVTIRQNGVVLYSTFVPAGPFVIDDLYSTPGGGDLEVEIEEIGGRTTRYFQPFAALPVMMREGVWNYNFGAGQYRHNYNTSRPYVGQFTLAYGLPLGMTAYGGAMAAQQGYQAGSLGIAFNMAYLGAISFDDTLSRSEDAQGKRQTGHALRLQYAKSFAEIGTDFTLAGYRYNSSGFRSLEDAVRDREYNKGYRYDRYTGQVYSNLYTRQHEYQLSLSQRIANRASISFNYYGVTYRNAPYNSTFSQLSFSSYVGRVGYAINYGINRSAWGERSNTVMLSLTIPLGGRHSAGYSISHGNDQGTSNDVSLSGSLTDDTSLTYALQTGLSSGGNAEGNRGSHGYASLGYSAPLAVINVNHGYSRNSSNSSVDISGALVIDDKGPLVGQSIGETAVIVDAPGAAGATVASYPGVRTNSQGRALVPYASPFRENRIALAAGDDDPDATLKQNVQNVVPTRGAIVVAKFDTEIGRTVFLVLRRADGSFLPFGSSIFDADGQQRGIVGPVGRVWLSGITGAARFTVKTNSTDCAFQIDSAQEKTSGTPLAKELVCG